MIKRLIIHDKVVTKSGDAPKNYAKTDLKSSPQNFRVRNAAQRRNRVIRWDCSTAMMPFPTLPPAPAQTVFSSPRPALVSTIFVSLASALTRKPAHSAVPPLPTKTASLGFRGKPHGVASPVPVSSLMTAIQLYWFWYCVWYLEACFLRRKRKEPPAVPELLGRTNWRLLTEQYTTFWTWGGDRRLRPHKQHGWERIEPFRQMQGEFAHQWAAAITVLIISFRI